MAYSDSQSIRKVTALSFRVRFYSPALTRTLTLPRQDAFTIYVQFILSTLVNADFPDALQADEGAKAYFVPPKTYAFPHVSAVPRFGVYALDVKCVCV